MRDTILNMNYKEMKIRMAYNMVAYRGCNKPLTRMANCMARVKEAENKFFIDDIVKQYINSKK